MTTQTFIRKLNQQMEGLRRDVAEIKEIIFSVFSDPEGEYRAKFVRKILARAKEIPCYFYKDKKSFFKQIYGRDREE